MQHYLRTAGVGIALVFLVGLLGPPAEAAQLNLHRGSHGSSVRVLESRLHTLHLLARSQVNRRYTLATVRAVKRFQRQQRVRVTGTVNLRTWNLVTAEVRRRTAPPKAVPVPAPPAAAPAPAPLVLGHRGARVPGITENTLKSMQYAADKVDILEFDLQLTADDEFVLMHDSTLDRTTSCAGRVVDQTLEYLRANCPTDNDSGPIPTFAEVAAYAAGHQLAIAPELKEDSVTDVELAKFVTVIHNNGLTSRTFVQSFYPALFPRLRALEGALTFVYLSDSAVAPASVVASGATIAGPNLSGLTAARVSAFKAAKLRVWSWTAATSAQLKSLWDMRVDGVFTDIPAAAHSMFHPV